MDNVRVTKLTEDDITESRRLILKLHQSCGDESNTPAGFDAIGAAGFPGPVFWCLCWGHKSEVQLFGQKVDGYLLITL